MARERVRDLWGLGAALVVLLFAAGGAATAPAVGILVRRHTDEFGLLLAMGYRQSYVRMLVVSIGALVSGFTAVVGSVVGGIALAVISGRGGMDPSFLPLYWIEVNPGLNRIFPATPLMPIAIAVGVATVVGALSALPAARHAATIDGHSRLWR